MDNTNTAKTQIKRPRIDDAKKAQILEAYKNRGEKKLKDIAADWNVSISAVSQIASGAGLTKKHNSKTS